MMNDFMSILQVDSITKKISKPKKIKNLLERMLESIGSHLEIAQCRKAKNQIPKSKIIKELVFYNIVNKFNAFDEE